MNFKGPYGQRGPGHMLRYTAKENFDLTQLWPSILVLIITWYPPSKLPSSREKKEEGSRHISSQTVTQARRTVKMIAQNVLQTSITVNRSAPRFNFELPF